MSWFAEHVTENPIVQEFRRYIRKFFSPSPNQTVNVVTAWLALAFYLSIFAMAARFASDVSPEAVCTTELIMLCFIIPGMTHGAIAGEREKRTWDLLLVAPITKTQIVVGKFVASLAVIAMITLAAVPFLGLCLFNKAWLNSTHGGVGSILVLQAMCMGYGAALAGIGLGVSASTHRSLVAHGLIHVIQISWLILVPFIIGVVGFEAERRMSLFHPFIAVNDYRVEQAHYPLFLIYSVLIVAFLALAYARVRSAEEV